MSDPLDDLRAELSSVTPSAGFEHRTKARIAREEDELQASARWGTRKWGGLAAAAAVIAIVATGLALRSPAHGRPNLANGGPDLPNGRPNVSNGGPDLQVRPNPTAPVAAAAVAPGNAAPLLSPQVRVAPKPRVTRAVMVIPAAAHHDQNIAVRRLMQLARAGTFAAPSNALANALPALDESGPVPVPVPIEISPITIAPLVPPGAAGRGGHEQ